MTILSKGGNGSQEDGLEPIFFQNNTAYLEEVF